MNRPLALSFALLVSFTACDPNADLREQASVAHLCWAEDHLRDADNASKAAQLAVLAKAPCLNQDACRMRDTCVAAYTVHVDGLNLTAMAKVRMSQGQDAEAARLLGTAEAKLKEAGPAVERCTTLGAELARRYRIDR